MLQCQLLWVVHNASLWKQLYLLSRPRSRGHMPSLVGGISSFHAITLDKPTDWLWLPTQANTSMIVTGHSSFWSKMTRLDYLSFVDSTPGTVGNRTTTWRFITATTWSCWTYSFKRERRALCRIRSFVDSYNSGSRLVSNMRLNLSLKALEFQALKFQHKLHQTFPIPKQACTSFKGPP